MHGSDERIIIVTLVIVQIFVYIQRELLKITNVNLYNQF